MCAHFSLSLFTPLSLTSSYQGTNGSQLWDSAFAAQAFLEVLTKQGCVVKVHDQRGRGHMVCVMTSKMGKTTAATLQTEDGDWSGDYRGPFLDGWYVCMNSRTVSASILYCLHMTFYVHFCVYCIVTQVCMCTDERSIQYVCSEKCKHVL